MTTASDNIEENKAPNQKRLAICIVSPMPPPYGGIAHWANLISGYFSNHDNFYVLVVDTAVRWRTVHDLVVYKRIIGGGIHLIKILWNILKVVAHERPDVIHLTTSGQFGIMRDFVIIYLARLFKIPLVYHIHFGRIPLIVQERSTEWKFLTHAMTRANCVVAIDKATELSLNENLTLLHVVRIPNCFDVCTISQIQITPGTDRFIVFLGYVKPAKGINELLEAWSILQHKNDWKLKILGSYDESFLLELRTIYNLQGVEFLGELEHSAAMNVLAQAEIFVLPSHTEGFPNVVLEAMALGKAIIATDVGAIPEMLEGNCGIVVPVQNVKELAAMIEKLIGDPHLRDELGKNACQKAKELYSLDVVFSQLCDVWLSCTKKQ